MTVCETVSAAVNTAVVAQATSSSASLPSSTECFDLLDLKQAGALLNNGKCKCAEADLRNAAKYPRN